MSFTAPLRRLNQIVRLLSTTMDPTKPSTAPWRAVFLDHLNQMSQKNFVLSTLHKSEGSSINFEPRCRYVIYRGLWACLPVNPKNQATLNPEMYESDLLTITSDWRMEKIPEIFNSDPSSQSRAASRSGKGGPVEAVFWIEKTGTQWRIKGHSYVIGPDIDSNEAEPVRSALSAHMRETGKKDGDFSWSRELTAHYGNLSPGMRGSFRNPPPGTPRDGKPEEGLGLGQSVTDLDDEIARKNFRVVVIVPEEVDRVDLSDPANQQRWKYRLENGGSWNTTECWP